VLKATPQASRGERRSKIVREAPPSEEAPEARGGPRSPDVFYRGEEAGAVLKFNSDNEMQHSATENIKKKF